MNKMESDNFWPLSIIVVATNGVSHLVTKAWQVLRLSEDRFPERTRGVSSLGCVLNQKNQFAHTAPQIIRFASN